ncbi:hypothetical protein CKW00_10420 [Salimicrobium humidisoli]|uniref:Uncharacterized protein n=1 Tax=Salimicrobium humidisoli TaxID=2029857 RepID=A0ABX4HPG7_9BACI|nr:hypothetical protein CKW00_10420 [Salimicrobium humidisoli]
MVVNYEDTLPLFLSSRALHKLLYVIFSIVSYEYCLQKTTFLIFLHQLFLHDSSLLEMEYNDESLLKIEEFITKKNQLYYIEKKVENLHKEYGMISLNENHKKYQVNC